MDVEGAGGMMNGKVLRKLKEGHGGQREGKRGMLGERRGRRKGRTEGGGQEEFPNLERLIYGFVIRAGELP